ncbi:MAG: hypothetical protein KF901_06450 [Myxococcales bacterium]|nr:hypothetical protein [Myxococcales bacterium]
MGHLAMLRLLNLGFALLAFAAAAAIAGLWTLPVVEGASEDVGIAFLGAAGATLFAGVGLAHLVVLVALGRGRGRALQTVLALALIVTLPLGTAYALYALWVCWLNPLTRAWLGAERARVARPFVLRPA